MKKATHETDRRAITSFEQIVNIGTSIADDFRRLGLSPTQLINQDPWKLYTQISRLDKQVHDPCVLDCFISAIDFMNGNPPQKWWHYTSDRKQKYGDRIAKFKTTLTVQGTECG